MGDWDSPGRTVTEAVQDMGDTKMSRASILAAPCSPEASALQYIDPPSPQASPSMKDEMER